MLGLFMSNAVATLSSVEFFRSDLGGGGNRAAEYSRGSLHRRHINVTIGTTVKDGTGEHGTESNGTHMEIQH